MTARAPNDTTCPGGNNPSTGFGNVGYMGGGNSRETDNVVYTLLVDFSVIKLSCVNFFVQYRNVLQYEVTARINRLRSYEQRLQ